MNDKVFIWPIWLRIVHWALALVIVLDAFVFLDGDLPHKIAGYAGLLLVLWRGWKGVQGRGPILFKNFPVSPGEIKKFAKNYLKKDHVYKGHNPLASIVYLLIWIDVIGLALTGWMMGLDAFWGSESLENVHELLSNFMLFLVFSHLLGLTLDAIIHKRKTWMKMIKGQV